MAKSLKYAANPNFNISGSFFLGGTSGYNGRLPGWCMAAFTKTGRITNISALTYCRESLATFFLYPVSFLHGGPKSSIPKDKAIYLSLASRRQKLMEEVEGWENRAMAILNPIEHELGWMRTRIRRAELSPKYMPRNYMIAITGSRKWIKSPPMTSLHSLLIRCVIDANDFTPSSSKADEVIEELLKECRKNRVSLLDKNRLLTVLPQVMPFLRKYSKIWGRKKEDLIQDKLQGVNGIQSFLRDGCPAPFKWTQYKHEGK